MWGRGGRPSLGRAADALRDAWERTSGADAKGLADLQQMVIFLEAKCGLLVFGAMVAERVRENFTVRELSEAEVNGLAC